MLLHCWQAAVEPERPAVECRHNHEAQMQTCAQVDTLHAQFELLRRDR
jgi:hypothetical protein